MVVEDDTSIVPLCSTGKMTPPTTYTRGYNGGRVLYNMNMATMATESDINTLNIQPRSYTNGAGKNVLVYCCY